MKIEFDPLKNLRNIELRGLAFDLAEEFDFDSALIVKDARRDYGEARYRATGRLGVEIAVVVFTIRGDAVRIISLRLASRKERLAYAQAE
jgi:uncharacterized DUF497 family protein